MTETTESPVTTPTGRGRRGEGLAGMVLADLKSLAGDLGLKGTSGMRKGDLVSAIAARQAGASPQHSAGTNGRGGATGDPTGGPAASGGEPAESTPQQPRRATGRRNGADVAKTPALTDVITQQPPADTADAAAQAATRRPATIEDASAQQPDRTEDDQQQRDGGRDRPSRDQQHKDRQSRDGRDQARDRSSRGRDAQSRDSRGQDARSQDVQGQDAKVQNTQGQDTQSREARSQNTQGQDAQSREGHRETQQGRQYESSQRPGRDDDDGDGRGRRGRRYRDRNRRGRPITESGEPEVREDDVLVPVAGIVDVLDSYAFIRTSGYLAGPNDVYVSLSQIRKYGLRRGDAVTGAVRAPREGEAQQQRQKFNPLVRLDSVNGLGPESALNRPEFTKLTPLYPNQRLRLETESHILTTRVIDLVMPVGKGQRALIVSPPKAGKTMVMQAIANAITTNNPECHLMVVLVDERPEEVTDMQRSVKGEVIASTFDRPPADHTMVAELAIERAKRLVEMGKDVVVLLDSITRLGRAYNLAAPASGRILSGGVDSTALFPPKRFLGAARNIEDGGSLTIFASALVETGSAGDTVIFEEFKGTGNAELKLDRRLADKRIFPAIDLDQSSTRKEDLLLSPDELAVTVKLRRVLAALDSQQALELVLDRLRKTRTNIEFLLQVAKNTPNTD